MSLCNQCHFYFMMLEGITRPLLLLDGKLQSEAQADAMAGLNDGTSDTESQLESPLFLLRKRKEGPDSQKLAWCSQIGLSSPVNTNNFTEHQHQTLYDGSRQTNHHNHD